MAKEYVQDILQQAKLDAKEALHLDNLSTNQAVTLEINPSKVRD